MTDDLTLAAKPCLSARARLRYDQVRAVDLLLLPERVVKLNPTAAAILGLCNGERTIGEIIQELGSRYGGSAVQADVVGFLQRVTGEGWIR